MDCTLKQIKADEQKSQCVIVGAYPKQKLSSSAQELDTASKGILKKILKDHDFTGDVGSTLLLNHIPGVNSKQVLIFGCGAKKLSPLTYKQIANACAIALKTNNVLDASAFVTELEFESSQNRSAAWMIREFMMSVASSFYSYNEFKSSQKSKGKKLPKLQFHLENKKDQQNIQKAIHEANAIIKGMDLCRDLGNCPANICTPTYLGEQAKKLAKEHAKITAEILSEKDMQALKMGSLLSVTQGSNTPAKFITLKYQSGKKQEAPIVLIGKGITFDTGGNSLKPATSMIGMKYDMCGGATVLGVLHAIAILQLPINVIGLIPACENTPGGSATRPDDIVTSMSGQTIEILNTDAEGRLILADALTYAEQFKPKAVIDMATLTGACVVALGNLATAGMTNHDPLAKDILKASEDIFDRAWQLPLWDDYHDSLKSPFADMKNIGDGGAGTIVAGCFLEKFAKNFHWAHLDIAGSAGYFNGPERGATGRPVPMMVQYLINAAS